MVKHRTMKTFRVCGGIAPLFLTPYEMEANGQLHVPAVLPQEEQLQLPTV
jgi:hypothetical protein